MSNSKFVMAQKLSRVQLELMNETITDTSLDSLISLIFKACSKQDLCFWFNILENEVVLNLRDVSHENYELNIRRYYEVASFDGARMDELKKEVLINAFLITNESVSVSNVASSEQQETETTEGIISTSKPTPPHVSEVIKIIKSKGIPVTKEAINNHLPWNSMGSNARIKCERFLSEMEDS